jgi:hypothetical protein
MYRLFKDENAQATTEYILMLSVAISIFLMVYAKLIKPFSKKFQASLAQQFNSLLFGADLHQFPIH